MHFEKSSSPPGSHDNEGLYKQIPSLSRIPGAGIQLAAVGQDQPHLFDLIENFALFMEAPGGLVKITAKNHQYLGVNNAMRALAEIRDGEGRLGVFWHTKGSGKSAQGVQAAFFASRPIRGDLSTRYEVPVAGD